MRHLIFLTVLSLISATALAATSGYVKICGQATPVRLARNPDGSAVRLWYTTDKGLESGLLTDYLKSDKRSVLVVVEDCKKWNGGNALAVSNDAITKRDKAKVVWVKKPSGRDQGDTLWP